VTDVFVGDWAKQETIAETPFKAKNEQINRAVQNNNPLGTLLEFLSYKAKFSAKQVVKFDEKGTTKTCSSCDYVGPATTTIKKNVSM
jgi:putative transposase